MTFLLISACGGQGQPSEEAARLSLKIENSRSPEGFEALTLLTLPSDRLKVVKFRLTVSGEGIEPPMSVEADGSASQLQLLEIPPGVNRSLLIEAFNQDAEVIRRRRIDGLTLSSGVVTPIQTSLNTIPLILNLRNGNIVQARNLKFECFGEPGSSLSLKADSTAGSISLNESVEGDPMILSPSVSTGLVDYIPPFWLRGRQTIVITDDQSQESSSVTITILDFNQRPGTRLSPAGGLHPPASVGPGFGGVKAHFPQILSKTFSKENNQ